MKILSVLSWSNKIILFFSIGVVAVTLDVAFSHQYARPDCGTSFPCKFSDPPMCSSMNTRVRLRDSLLLLGEEGGKKPIYDQNCNILPKNECFGNYCDLLSHVCSQTAMDCVQKQGKTLSIMMSHHSSSDMDGHEKQDYQLFQTPNLHVLDINNNNNNYSTISTTKRKQEAAGDNENRTVWMAIFIVLAVLLTIDLGVFIYGHFGGGPTIEEICNGRAGIILNILYFPFVCLIGLTFRSVRIFCLPCIEILFLRCARIMNQYCRCYLGKWPYEDPEFFGATALGDFSKIHPENPNAEQMNEGTDWVRAEHLDAFQGKRPQLFAGKIETSDLCQGAVGDCWLVAAFACASEFPDFVRNFFITKEYNPRGLYKARLFDPQNKKWVIITVDDRIPCEKGEKVPRFMNPNGNELWAIILEKVYAKFCGSYAKLSDGVVAWGWHSMTGDPVFQLAKNNEGLWERGDIVILDNKEDKRDCAMRPTQEKYSTEQLWTQLQKYNNQKALISASITKDTEFQNIGPAGEQILEKEGLVAGHAYSIIQSRQVNNRLRLIKLCNPWGTFEWKGDWSDESPLWKQNKSVAKAVGFKDLEDGVFWMSFDDFVNHYSEINICDRTTTEDVALDVTEDHGSWGIIRGWLWGCFQYWCLCLSCRKLYGGHDSTDTTLDDQERGCFGKIKKQIE